MKKTILCLFVLFVMLPTMAQVNETPEEKGWVISEVISYRFFSPRLKSGRALHTTLNPDA